MTCKKCEKLFSSCLDGDPDIEERRRFEDHLEECEQCSAEFARFKKVVTLTAGLPPIHPSRDFDSSLRAKLADSEGVTRLGWLFGRRAVATFGVICLLLAMAFGTYMYRINRKGHQSEDERIEFLVGREIVPMVRSHTDENILTNFVIPTVPAVRTSGSSSDDIDTATYEDRQETRTFVLPFIMDEHPAQDEPDTNYVLKSISLTSTLEETGL